MFQSNKKLTSRKTNATSQKTRPRPLHHPRNPHLHHLRPSPPPIRRKPLRQQLPNLPRLKFIRFLLHRHLSNLQID